MPISTANEESLSDFLIPVPIDKRIGNRLQTSLGSSQDPDRHYRAPGDFALLPLTVSSRRYRLPLSDSSPLFVGLVFMVAIRLLQISREVCLALSPIRTPVGGFNYQ